MFRFFKMYKKKLPAGQNCCRSIEEFHQRLQVECRRSSYNEQEFSLILLTLDTNSDTPKKIQELIKHIHLQIRDIDIIGEYSTKSIGIIMPYTEEKGARGFMQKIRGSIMEIERYAEYALYKYLPHENQPLKINRDGM